MEVVQERTRAGKKNGNGTGDTAGSDNDVAGMGEKKRKRRGAKNMQQQRQKKIKKRQQDHQK